MNTKKSMQTKEGQKVLGNAGIEALERVSNSMKEECKAGRHSDEHYCYSGADIYWRCRRCGKVTKQEGGNLPMTF